MRIISGQFRGRKFKPPGVMPARPTTDVAREGLFNVLQSYLYFDEIKTLDLFGGTGFISYELASRGAVDLTIVERDRKLGDFIALNMGILKVEDKVRLVRDDVFKFLSYDKGHYDFIFAGPPYALETIDTIPDLACNGGFIAPGGVFVLEHTPRNNFEQHPHFFRVINYGTTKFSFFKNKD